MPTKRRNVDPVDKAILETVSRMKRSLLASPQELEWAANQARARPQRTIKPPDFLQYTPSHMKGRAQGKRPPHKKL